MRRSAPTGRSAAGGAAGLGRFGPGVRSIPPRRRLPSAGAAALPKPPSSLLPPSASRLASLHPRSPARRLPQSLLHPAPAHPPEGDSPASRGGWQSSAAERRGDAAGAPPGGRRRLLHLQSSSENSLQTSGLQPERGAAGRLPGSRASPWICAGLPWGAGGRGRPHRRSPASARIWGGWAEARATPTKPSRASLRCVHLPEALSDLEV